jgi:hypothetical protein
LGPDAKIPENKVDGLKDHFDRLTSSTRAVYAIVEKDVVPSKPTNDVEAEVSPN